MTSSYDWANAEHAARHAPGGADDISGDYAQVPTINGGVRATDLSVSASTLTTVFTTPSLAAGTWLLTATLAMLSGASAVAVEYEWVVGSAAATFTGPSSGAARANTGSVEFGGSLTAIVNISTAGTLLLKTECASAFTVLAATNVQGWAGASGWAAYKLL